MSKASNLLHTGFFFAYSLTLKMVTCSPKILIDFQWTTLHCIPENRTLLKLNFPILCPAKFWVCRNYQTEDQVCGIVLTDQALFTP